MNMPARCGALTNDVIPNWDLAPPELTWKERVAYLTVQFLKLPQIECPVEHGFPKGWYTRTMFIPADTLFLGRSHIKGHKCVLERGEVIHLAEGLPNTQVKAPFQMVTWPGYQMVFYTITDCIGVTWHHNTENSRDIEKLEAAAFEPVQNLIDLGTAVESRMLTWQA